MTTPVLLLYLEYINKSYMLLSMPLTKSMEDMFRQVLGEITYCSRCKRSAQLFSCTVTLKLLKISLRNYHSDLILSRFCVFLSTLRPLGKPLK